MKTFLFVILLFLIGCSGSKETTEIRDEQTDYTPPPTIDSFYLGDTTIYRYIPQDSSAVENPQVPDIIPAIRTAFHIYRGTKVTDRGDTIHAKFDGQMKMLSLWINYTSQVVTHPDTTKWVQPADINKGPSFWAYLGYGTFTLLVGAAGYGLGKMKFI